MERLAIEGGYPVRGGKIYYGRQWIGEDDIRAVEEVLRSDYITCGPKVDEFEQELARYTGAKYAVAVSNGTAALHCACLAAGIGPGDEVITTPMTFASTASTILHTGATPVFADIDYRTGCIDPAEIEKTRRVLPMGYWKGSGISIALDLIATILSNGNSVHKIGTFGDEVGLTQIMIAIDPGKANSTELTDQIVNDIINDVKTSVPEKEGGQVYYPGELALKNMRENMELGIPVIEEKWNQVLAM